MKNTQGKVLLLVKLQALNGTKSRKTSHALIFWKPFPLLIIDKFAIFY